MPRPQNVRLSFLLALAALQFAPLSSGAQTITEFATPTAGNPDGITRGADGNIWYGKESGKIGRVTPAGVVTEFTPPTITSVYGIGLGPDGNVWFGSQGAAKIAKITPSGTFTEYTTPSAGGHDWVANGPDNNLWFTGYSNNKIVRFNPNTSVFTEFAIPTAASAPLGITAGPDGNLWFAETSGNKIGRITTAGVITEYTIPTAASAPKTIVAGPDGNLWFGEVGANKIGRITTVGVITEFPIPTGAAEPWGITAGLDGAIWFTEYGTNKVGRITTAGVITGELIAPTAGSGPDHITALPDGTIWFTEYNVHKIAKIDLPVPSTNPLLASILPTSRSVQVGNFATVFATIANNSLTPQTQCRITTDTYVPGFFSYQTTNPATNALSGTPNTSASISANGLQTYVLAFRAGSPLPPTDVKFIYICDGVKGATPITGVNTLQLVFDAGPVADMIAVGVTPSNDGYAHTGGNSGTGVFAVATTNIGPATVLTAKPRLSDPALPLTVTICETNSSAACLAPPAAQVSRSFGNNEASSFGVFIKANGAVPPDPAARRVFLEFLDAGSIVRGSTSTAVTTQ